MAIADTITSMQTHTSNAYTMIGYGTDLTGINKNLENLSTSIFNAFLEALRNPDTLFTNLPKKSGTGANITLNDTANAPMRIELGASELTQAGTPTPSSPQNIHTISGSNTIKVFGNIYDYTDLKQTYSWLTYDEDGWYTATINNTSSSGSYYNFTTNFSNLLETDTAYSIITEVKSITTSGSGGTINSWDRWGQFSTGISTGYSAVGTYVGTSTTKSDFTSVSQMLASSIYVRANSSITATFRISVLKGTNITTSNFVYQPYTSQEADIDLTSKNLLNNILTTQTLNGITATRNNDGSITLNGTAIAQTDFTFLNTKLEFENGTYTFSISKVGNNNVQLQYGVSGYGIMDTGTAKTSYTTTFPNTSMGTSYSYINMFRVRITNGAVLNNYTIYPMIEKGNVATNYVSFYNYGEYCKIGNYADKIFKNIPAFSEYDSNLIEGAWYIKKNIGKVVLDGSEADWTLNNSGTPNYSYRLSIAGQLITGNGISNLYPYVSAIYDGNTVEGFALSNASTTYLQIRIRYGTEQTLNDFKTFLGTNNLIIYYILSTPTYTKITGTLAEQLENVYQKLLSYSGTTNISQVNNDLAFNMNVSAIEE